MRALASQIAGRDPVTVFIGRVSDQPVAARTIQQDVAVVSSQLEKFERMRAYLDQLRGRKPKGAAAAANDDSDAEEEEGDEEDGDDGQERGPNGGVSKHPLRVIVFAGTKSKVEELKMWFDEQ